jgi:acetylornithine deacetylase/succinyl-diaminopimelate desuccinylase-like protein
MSTSATPLAWSAVLPDWLGLLSRFLSLRPFSRENAAGVRAALELLAQLLIERGFTVEQYPNPSPEGAGILVASRAPRGRCTRTVGLFAHVDVEDVTPGEAWQSADPLQPQLRPDGRYYCRGIADNLGPLLARLLAFRVDDSECAGVVWVVQGEEEIGSPFAHAELPAIKAAGAFARVDLWIEETGYFTADGTQRVLTMHRGVSAAAAAAAAAEGSTASPPAIELALRALATNAAGREMAIQERFLNKSFGSNCCPCIAHLVDGSIPYLSFGINDVHSMIHDIDESVRAETLPIAFEQFKAVLVC